MVLFLPQTSRQSFNKCDRRLYCACQTLIVLSCLVLAATAAGMTAIALTVKSPYMGPEARQFVYYFRLIGYTTIGACSLGLFIGLTCTWRAAVRNRVRLHVAIVEDDDNDVNGISNA